MSIQYCLTKTLLSLLFLILCSSANAAVSYYVDQTNGSDSNLGTSVDSPWKTIAKVNSIGCASPIHIYFKCGETWRERLLACSGTSDDHSIYTSYGSGNKPKIIGSIQLANASDWVNESGNLWYHAPDSTTTGSSIASTWHLYVGSGSATLASTGSDNATVTMTTNGSSASSIQVYNSNMSITAGKLYKVSFRAKMSAGASATLSWGFAKSSSPWTWYHYHRTNMSTSITDSWSTYEILLRANVTASDTWFNAPIGLAVPAGSILYIDTFSVKELVDQTNIFYGDVGMLVFNNEADHGIWKYTKPELASQGDFWYDYDTWRLYVYSSSNPATYYSNIETIWDSTFGTFGSGACASGVHLDGVDYTEIRGLDVRYWVCGIGTGVWNNSIVSGNDLSFIGGCPNMGTVRYGNAIEYLMQSSITNDLIEKNQIHDVWDVGIAKEYPITSITNLKITNNYIWNVGLSGIDVAGWTGSQISSIVGDGVTATVTTATAHGLSSGYGVIIFNTTHFDGTYTITVTGDYSFTVSSSVSATDSSGYVARETLINGFYILNNTIYNGGGGIFGGATGRTQGYPACITLDSNTGSATNFYIQNNVMYSDVVFNETTAWYTPRVLFVGGGYNPHFSDINMDYNLMYRKDRSKQLIFNYATGYVGGSSGLGIYTGEDFSRYQSDKHKDQNSVSLNPYDVSSRRNRGTNSSVVTDDFYGLTRPQEGTTDIGAFEHSSLQMN